MTIYILGRSFIGENLRIKLSDIIHLSHNDVDKIRCAKDNDIIINTCGISGVYKDSPKDEYYEGNYIFLEKIIGFLKESPFFIHISSLMVNGFEGINNDSLEEHQKWYIESKLLGEEHLLKYYPVDKLCICRPSNVYGYNCKPYKNSIISSLIYEKINGVQKIVNINKNCVRNFISVEALCDVICKIMDTRKIGIVNIISNNNLNLGILLEKIYRENTIPKDITINNGELNIFKENSYETIICNENIDDNFKNMEMMIRTSINI
jgi:nucleoside-diphosphate-sugar epimerase